MRSKPDALRESTVLMERANRFAELYANDIEDARSISRRVAAGETVPTKPCSFCSRETRLIFRDGSACCSSPVCVDASSRRHALPA